MNITASEGHEWRQWVLVTSIPLVRLDERNIVVDFGSGTMIDHAGSRFNAGMGSGMSIDLSDSAAGTHVASSINKSILMSDPIFRL